MSKYPCIGIDLGTTYSALAVINPAGRPEIVPNSDGERIMRSAIFLQENATILVGEVAKRNAGHYPERVAQWIKLQMGDAEWRFSFDGQAHSAIELSGMILKKLKKDAEERLGAIKYAVVTVPAYFDETRRVATISAAKLAGLELLEVINEPTAAAIAYASTGGRPGTILVYDFGGGTFDVSIVKVKSQFEIEVIASEGDHRLGGYDLDKRLARYFVQQLKEQKDVTIPEDEKNGDWLELISLAETVKKNLSSMKQDRCRPCWGAHTITIDIQRQAFEQLISEEILRTQMLVENALDAAKLKPNQIDEVLLVGGSTRIPAVKEMLRRKFAKDPISHVNVDEAVALGAAIKAGYLMHQKGLTELSPQAAAVVSRTRLQDVVTHSLGTLAVCDVGGSERLRNVILIKKNSTIPVSKKDTFYTRINGQTAVDCSVTTGEDEDPEFNNPEPMLKKNMELPPNRPAGRPIEVTYSIDANGVMKFEFKDIESGHTTILESQAARKAQQLVEEVEADFEDLEIE